MTLLRALSLFLLLLAGSTSRAQVQPYGMEKWWITAIATEQGDVNAGWSGSLANQVFAATNTDGLFQANVSRASALWTPIGPFRDAPIDIPAICVQHWGAGPRDGLHVFASQRYNSGSADLPVLWRAEANILDSMPPQWERADSGIAGVDTAMVIYSLAAFYYTGHTPLQPVLAGTGQGGWQGSAGAQYWTPSVFNDPLAAKVNAIDVMPKWFGTHAWAAGRSGVMPAAFRSNDQGLNWKSLPVAGADRRRSDRGGHRTRHQRYRVCDLAQYRASKHGRRRHMGAMQCDPQQPFHRARLRSGKSLARVRGRRPGFRADAEHRLRRQLGVHHSFQRDTRGCHLHDRGHHGQSPDGPAPARRAVYRD